MAKKYITVTSIKFNDGEKKTDAEVFPAGKEISKSDVNDEELWNELLSAGSIREVDTDSDDALSDEEEAQKAADEQAKHDEAEAKRVQAEQKAAEEAAKKAETTPPAPPAGAKAPTTKK